MRKNGLVWIVSVLALCLCVLTAFAAVATEPEAPETNEAITLVKESLNADDS